MVSEWIAQKREREQAAQERLKERARTREGRQDFEIGRIWSCPHCGHYNFKWSSLHQSSRYYAVEGNCNNPDVDACREHRVKGRKTRNILPHTEREMASKSKGRRLTDRLNNGLDLKRYEALLKEAQS